MQPRAPLRFCNRYVGESAAFGLEGAGNLVALSAAGDLRRGLSLVSDYTGRPLHVESVKAGVRVHRGADLAHMREVDLPARVRPGQTITARLTVQRLRGPRSVRRIRVKLPSDLERGSRRIILQGTDPDQGDLGFLDALVLELEEESGRGRARDESALDAGPQSLRALAKAVAAIARYDGVSLFVDRPRGKGRPVFRDPKVRLAGRVSDRVRVR